MESCDEETMFFRENRESLERRFGGKVVVIKGRKVVAVYENLATAQREAAREFLPGTFLVQRIERA